MAAPRVSRNNDSIPALCFSFVSNLDPLDISVLSRHFESVFAMYKMAGGGRRRESGCNAIMKEAGKERPGGGNPWVPESGGNRRKFGNSA